MMARIQGRGNQSTELKMVAILRAHGIRGWRRHVAVRISLGEQNRGRVVHPDFVFRRARLALFIDGCFWHGCPWHGTRPRNNAGFWRAKIEGNRERDRRFTRALRASGWTVIRVWEHALRAGNVDPLVGRIMAGLEQGDMDPVRS
jgi:DNA mismatch endonuclease (patch repair protein)